MGDRRRMMPPAGGIATGDERRLYNCDWQFTYHQTSRDRDPSARHRRTQNTEEKTPLR